MDSQTSSIATLIQATAAGDAAAWAALDERLRPQLVAVAARVLQDAHLAEDVAQETMLSVRQAASGFRLRAGDPDAAGLRYCKAIAAHKALNLRRRSGHAVLDSAADVQLGQGLSPEESVMTRELADVLRDCLSELQEPFAEALALHHLGGLSRREIADKQGVSEATVHTRIWRGLRKLRGILRRRGLAVGILSIVAAMAELRAEVGLSTPPLLVTSLCSNGVIIMSSITVAAATVLFISWPLFGIGAAEAGPKPSSNATSAVQAHAQTKQAKALKTVQNDFSEPLDLPNLQGIEPLSVDLPQAERVAAMGPWLRRYYAQYPPRGSIETFCAIMAARYACGLLSAEQANERIARWALQNFDDAHPEATLDERQSYIDQEFPESGFEVRQHDQGYVLLRQPRIQEVGGQGESPFAGMDEAMQQRVREALAERGIPEDRLLALELLSVKTELEASDEVPHSETRSEASTPVGLELPQINWPIYRKSVFNSKGPDHDITVIKRTMAYSVPGDGITLLVWGRSWSVPPQVVHFPENAPLLVGYSCTGKVPNRSMGSVTVTWDRANRGPEGDMFTAQALMEAKGRHNGSLHVIDLMTGGTDTIEEYVLPWGDG